MKFSVAISIFFIFSLWSGCSEKSDQGGINDSRIFKEHEFKVFWLANRESDMKAYHLFWWHGEDAASCPFEEGKPMNVYAEYFIKMVPHNANVDTIKTTYPDNLDGGWIQAAVAAENNQGKTSVVSLSNFLHTDVVEIF